MHLSIQTAPVIFPYTGRTRVSWLEGGSMMVNLAQGLAPADSKVLHPSHIHIPQKHDDFLNHVSTHRPYKPHCDPTLLSDPTIYSSLLCSLRAAGMVRRRAATEKQGALGVSLRSRRTGPYVHFGAHNIDFDSRTLLRLFSPPRVPCHM